MDTLFELKKLQQKVDLLILSTPTSKLRERLTEINIELLKMIDDISVESKHSR